MSSIRDEALLSLRPTIQSIDQSKSISESEAFQSQTLRPILKYQNDSIKSLFFEKINDQQLSLLDEADQRQRITKQLENNTVLRNRFIGMVIGLMTSEEIINYFAMESEMKRRIKTMLVERLMILS